MVPSRVIAWIAGAGCAWIGAYALVGPAGILVAGAVIVATFLWQLMWLPRSAHAAFARGKLGQAARRYRVLGALSLTRARVRAATLSRAGSLLAAGKLDAAEAIHGTFDAEALEPGERAVWLNNRACAMLAANRSASDALAIVEDAIALRPDVPAVQHTRGQALVALGRIDDAIAVFDRMRAGGDLPDRLEAERCRDLAKAWEAKGETAYAEDYRERARRYG